MPTLRSFPLRNQIAYIAFGRLISFPQLSNVLANRRPSPIVKAAKAAHAALRNELPPRYAHYHSNWERDFWTPAGPALQPGAQVLDVGSGRRPALPQNQRAQGLTYVGLDLSRSELEAAPPGSYDEIVAGDITERMPALEGRFDLVVSWQVLEHVRSLERALANFHAYLVEGGSAVALLSGRYSVFGVANLLLPQRFGVPLVARIMHRDPSTVFRAYYDHCHLAALERLLTSWSRVRVHSLWCGATYFTFSRHLQASYIFYEEWAATAGFDNLATHYLVELAK